MYLWAERHATAVVWPHSGLTEVAEGFCTTQAYILLILLETSLLVLHIADDINARVEASFRPGKTGSFPNPNAKMLMHKSYIYRLLILSVYIVLVTE